MIKFFNAVSQLCYCFVNLNIWLKKSLTLVLMLGCILCGIDESATSGEVHTPVQSAVQSTVQSAEQTATGQAGTMDGAKGVNSFMTQGYVGSMQRLTDVVVSGSKLIPRPLDNRRMPIVLRMVQVRPHGEAFRYDLEFVGLEPGDFDLRDYLVRADGSLEPHLPSLKVKILSALPEGHIPPHELKNSLPWLGSYRVWVWVAGIFWLAVFLGLIFYRRPASQTNVSHTKPLTFAEMLKPRLQSALQGSINAHQLAELERYLVEFWRRKLGWFDRDPVSVVVDLRKHPQAGPLMTQLEQWIHARQRNTDVDLDQLLKPYQEFEASELDGLRNDGLRSDGLSGDGLNKHELKKDDLTGVANDV